jgi:hypothetical protein
MRGQVRMRQVYGGGAAALSGARMITTHARYSAVAEASSTAVTQRGGSDDSRTGPGRSIERASIDLGLRSLSAPGLAHNAQSRDRHPSSQ